MNTERSPIKEDDTIYDIVISYPQLKDVLMKLSPRFIKLHNPVMFQTAARITSVKQAAKVGGLYLKELLYQLNDAIGLGDAYFSEEKKKVSGLRESFLKTSKSEEVSKPEWLEQAHEWPTHDIRLQEGDPFSIINEWTDDIERGKGITLIQKFEPIPLLNYLKLKGFEHHVDKKEQEEYYIYLYKSEGE